jgi:anti-sigma regulatory factor (Ser/Thr protein kinase)
MIDLSRNRAELLAEIEAPRVAGEVLSDITDPRFASADVRARVNGHAKRDLFPLLKVVLSERFADVARLELLRDLLIPLRNALGNAYKHGNDHDSSKAVSVELTLTRKGALIAITDQGAGFDVALTLRRFQEQNDYFANRGAGFRNLQAAASTVSYENGGRTVLLCFRPTMREQDDASPSPSASVGHPAIDQGESAGGHASHESVNSRRTKAHSTLVQSQSLLTLAAARPRKFAVRADGLETADARANVPAARWLEACLSTGLPEFANHDARIESCRVYAPRGRANDGCGIRYLLRMASRDGRPAATRVLTGRLHATATAAAADFEFAAGLHAARIETRMLIPRPVAWFASEPPLVLYDFDPWLNLKEYLTHRRSLKSVRHAAERAGETLSVLHRSRVLGRGPEFEAPAQRLPLMIDRTERSLRSLSGGSELLNRFRACAQAVQKQVALHRPRAPAPIHGALDWDCIQYGIEGRFYLYRFESSGWSDPGHDLGGFAAELLRFTRSYHDEDAYRICRDAFLHAYNLETARPMSVGELRFYIAFALIERLQRDPSRAAEESGEWLAALESDLWGWPRSAEIGMSA